MRIKLDINSIKTMGLFEKVTRASLKDYFESEGIKYFVVNPGEIGKAIGKNGANIKRLEQMIKSKIKIVEYNNDLVEFVQNMLYPMKLANAEEKEEEGKKILLLEAADSRTRGMIIGRNASSLRALEESVRRYFKLDEIKV
jgi:transcription termination/antitermination protein NusA